MKATPQEFYQHIRNAVEQQQFLSLNLSKKNRNVDNATHIDIRYILLKEEPHFHFIYHFPLKDLTKNTSPEKGYEIIEQLFGRTYLVANLYMTTGHFTYEFKRKHKVKVSIQNNAVSDQAQNFSHDKAKTTWELDKRYLKRLGILNSNGTIARKKGDKHKQIHKFIEIIDAHYHQSSALQERKELKILDMGAGKGYLTFAIYDYFKNHVRKPVEVIGIELRENLVDLGNELAHEVGFEGLNFEQAFIEDFEVEKPDLLIALHACDTATDDALYYGIKNEAKLIICSPCCHKQIRKEIQKIAPFDSIVKYGILLERQAEILTDAIRALLLERAGYKTKVFEFISTEHTGKNVMITAQKHNRKVDIAYYDDKIEKLKAAFGIQQHYLESLLGSSIPIKG